MRYGLWTLVWVLALSACDDSAQVGSDMLGLDAADGLDAASPDLMSLDLAIHDRAVPDRGTDGALPDGALADMATPLADMGSADLGTPGHIGYWPALARGPKVYLEADFNLSPSASADGIWLAAGDGFVGLGADQYFIKNTELVHLAVGFLPGDVVELRDETQPSHLAARWVFTYTDNLGRAVGVASRNMNPVTYIER